MSDNDPRPFLCCHCQWIIGESYREPGNRIIKLRVYRHARDPLAGIDLSGLPDHKKYSITRVADGRVECDQCGVGTHWFPNETAIAEMLMRRSVRRAKCEI
jgi:hypothetical protein